MAENKRISRMYLEEEKSKPKGGITPFPKIGFEDMTKMEDMSLDGVLENLRERYSHQLIYVIYCYINILFYYEVLINFIDIYKFNFSRYQSFQET